MKIDARKLKNNNQLQRELDELNMYITDEIPIDMSESVFRHRQRMYKDAYHKLLNEEVSVIVKPNNKHISFDAYLKKHTNKENDDYEIQVYWKQVNIAHYSGHNNQLNVDKVLAKNTWFLNYIYPLVRDEIPNEKHTVMYNVHYVDWNDRPFILTELDEILPVKV